MQFAALVVAFAGWGAAGWFASSLTPGLGFLIGLAVGAGAMLIGRDK